MRKGLLLFVLLCSAFLKAGAQQELEYKMEIGAMVGPGFYLGDTNYSGFYQNINAAGGLMARYNINPRMALKFDIAAGQISGSSKDRALIDAMKAEDMVSFRKTVVDVGCQYELHLWAYGTGKSFKGTKRLCPYIQMGLGFTAGNAFTANIPLGFGVKYKVTDRLNVGLDWSVRITMSDKLDGISDPYHISSGFLKNKDSYCWTMFYVSYDFFPKLRKCNN